MFSLRYFGSQASYNIVMRQIGLRNFAKIQFMQGYSLAEPAAAQIAEPEPAAKAWTDKIHSAGS